MPISLYMVAMSERAKRRSNCCTKSRGRAGRGDVRGEVMLQTHEPDHPVMQALISDDRDAFYETELAQREMMALPPYGRLAAIVLSDPEEDRLDNFCRELVQKQPREDADLEGIKVFGPAAAPISVIRGRHRRRFLVRGCAGGAAATVYQQMAAWHQNTRRAAPVGRY